MDIKNFFAKTNTNNTMIYASDTWETCEKHWST